MGRPSEQNERSEQGKAGTSLWILLIGIVSLVLSIVAVAIPYWGNFSLATGGGTGFSSRSRDGDGYFGPFQVCRYSYGSAYASACDSDVRGEGQRGPGGFEKQVFIVIGGICAIVEVVALGLFTICAGLHCAMLINNKHIWLKYKRNIFLAVISAAIAVLAAVGASVLGGIEISSKKAQYEVTIGAALVLEIILIFLNTGLLALSYRAYRKSKKAIFPRPHAPYEISGDRYEPSSHAGIAVTGTSGDLYPNQQAPPIHLTTSALPQYPAPASTQYLPASSQQQYPSNTNGNVFQGAYINGGQINNAYNGTLPQYAQPAYNLTGQLAQPQVQSRPSIPSGVSMGVNLNPEGRVSYNPLKGPGHGSMDSLNSTQSLTNSLGSTGSFSSNISNPIRSSMKKPKNKDNPSVASGLSKKSVTIAIGAEQTAV